MLPRAPVSRATVELYLLAQERSRGRARALVRFFVSFHVSFSRLLVYVSLADPLALACPANSAGAPTCSCNSGYTGTLTFGGGVWSGSCSCKPNLPCRCPHAQWLLAPQTQPAHHRVRAAQATAALYHSILELERGLGLAHVRIAHGPGWLLISVVSCPANAAGAPSCACSSGYSGALSFNMGTRAWTGSCSCTHLFHFRLTFSGSLSCERCWGPSMCLHFWLQRSPVVQRWHAGMVWRLLMYVCQIFLIHIIVVSCPANAAGAPSCACSSGYSGALSFNTGTRAWTGACSSTSVSIASSHFQRLHAQRTRLEPPPAHVTTALRREHFRLAPARSHTLHRALVK
jgi:hypothetical protein